MPDLVKAGVVGASGYGGVELVRLLRGHPYAKLEAVSSRSFHGQNISDIYAGLRGGVELVLEKDPAEMLDRCQVVFAALPHGLSQELAKECIDRNKILIDLGADFRLENEDEYRDWYGETFLDKELHKQAVYGLSEIFRERIKTAKLIANPGCYPTSAALALYPGLKAGLINPEGIIIDSKSGVTGAGRSMTQSTHFPECNEGFSAYKAGGHRHIPEIEQALSWFSGAKVNVTFTPHLLPVNRGILSTIYCSLNNTQEALRRCYEETYANEPFVTILRDGEYANIRNVRLSNSCHISLHYDMRTQKLIICSAIDNMVKGAAGQAIQNMNIALGMPEDSGLAAISPSF
ncbi:N-acetyl-gamma-glutamyl-phosphate reductase [Bacillota bacterium]